MGGGGASVLQCMPAMQVRHDHVFDVCIVRVYVVGFRFLGYVKWYLRLDHSKFILTLK